MSNIQPYQSPGNLTVAMRQSPPKVLDEAAWSEPASPDFCDSVALELAVLCYPALIDDDKRWPLVLEEFASYGYTVAELVYARREVPHDPSAGHKYHPSSTTLLPDVRSVVDRIRTTRDGIASAVNAASYVSAATLDAADRLFPSVDRAAFDRCEDGYYFRRTLPDGGRIVPGVGVVREDRGGA